MAFDNFLSPLVPEQENGCANAQRARKRMRVLTRNGFRASALNPLLVLSR